MVLVLGDMELGPEESVQMVSDQVVLDLAAMELGLEELVQVVSGQVVLDLEDMELGLEELVQVVDLDQEQVTIEFIYCSFMFYIVNLSLQTKKV